MINREAPPFNKPELRRAVALTVDRRAFIDTLTQGKGDIGGACSPPPEGIWGMPAELMQQLPGYDPDVAKNRAEARKIMEKQGYGPDKRLTLKVSTRNIPPYRDPAVILLDQLKQIYIDAELEPVDTPSWYPEGRAQGLHDRRQPDRQRHRRPRPDLLRELRLRFGKQLRRLLQPGDRQAVRPAIDGGRPGKAQEDGLGDRAPAGRGCRAPGALPQPLGDLLASLREGLHADGQQHLQRQLRMEDVWLDK